MTARRAAGALAVLAALAAVVVTVAAIEADAIEPGRALLIACGSAVVESIALAILK